METHKPAATTALLQSLLRTNPRLRLEFMAGVSKLFRDHEIDIAPEALTRITLSVEDDPVPSPNSDDPRAFAPRGRSPS